MKISALAVSLIATCASVADARRLYVSIYNTQMPTSCPATAASPDGKGYTETSLYIYDLNTDGSLTKVSEVAAGLNVSWIAHRPAGTDPNCAGPNCALPEMIYAVSETCLYNGAPSGSVSAYQVVADVR
jgi:hypothetical protein